MSRKPLGIAEAESLSWAERDAAVTAAQEPRDA